jgi:lysyl-tRNA synthetase class 2
MSSRPPAPSSGPEPASTLPIDQLIAQRREKLNRLTDHGVHPYPYRFARTHTIPALLQEFKTLEHEAATPTEISTAGRLMALRDMGKSCFAHIAEGPHRLQIYVKMDTVGEEAYRVFHKDLDIGDIVGLQGTMFRTKTKELTLRVKQFTLLAKSLRPLPEKWHGLKDVETRYRQRELDLISNPAVQGLFAKRSQLVQSLRQTLYQEGFLEVETPLLQTQAGGAAARPFKTFHNVLQSNLFLRIALEIHLKRLLVGGVDRVFEIGRVFRNEGVDTQHNPEFTLLEAYQAYADYNDMMALTEKLVVQAAKTCRESTEWEWQGKPLSVKPPFARAGLSDLFLKHTGQDVLKAWNENRLREVVQDILHTTLEPTLPEHKVFDRVFVATVLPHLWEPTFVLDYPLQISPLAKKHRSKPGLVERFELFIAGQELANAYSELNDPIDQRARLEKQMALKKGGDEEVETADEAFLVALEQGMPPAGGLGIGVDRLAMLLLGQTSIREVILFPLLKPET